MQQIMQFKLLIETNQTRQHKKAETHIESVFCLSHFISKSTEHQYITRKNECTFRLDNYKIMISDETE